MFGPFPLPVHSCTIGAVTSGCEYQEVAANFVDRDNATGDLEIFQLAASPVGTLCIDFSSGVPPFNFAGVTGTWTGTGFGQILSVDAAGHGLAWFSQTFTGTETKP
jgi:hypothetical protein